MLQYTHTCTVKEKEEVILFDQVSRHHSFLRGTLPSWELYS